MWDLDYKDLYQLSIDHPETYWDEVAKDVVWTKPYTSVLEDKDSTSPRWYVGGELNMSYNCLDRQVQDGFGDDVAVIHDSAITGTVSKLTYKEFLDSVELLAGVMVQTCGMIKGDRVLLYFPMIPQCLISMLACTRIGAISTTVFTGFATKELAARIKFFEPKLIICSNVGLEPGEIINYKERVDEAIEMIEFSPSHCIVYNRPNYLNASLKKGRDLDWTQETKKVKPQGWIPVESEHPHYVAFTSGTTGEPKGILKTTAGSVVSNMNALKRRSGLKPGEVWWAMSDFGWSIGQGLSSYAPLMSRNPTIIYEGKVVGTPDSSQITRVFNQHKVVSFVGAPTVMKILRKFCSESDLELTYTGLRSIHLGGECVDSSIRDWTSRTFKCNVYNVWGQTEVGDAAFSAGLGLKGSRDCYHDDSIGLIMPGFQCKIVKRETGEPVPTETVGRLLFKMPMVPSNISTLYKDHERFVRTYLAKYPGYYDTMDAALMTKEGLVKVVAREDDIIHVGAARICGSAIEEACLTNEFVLDVAVVALEDSLKGFVPFAFLIQKNDMDYTKINVVDFVINNVLKIVGEVASFNNAVIVPSLPRTKTGKIPRNALADMLNGKEYKIPSTVENPESFSVIYEELLKAGYKVRLPTLS